MAQTLHTASCGEVVEQGARDNAPSFLALLPHEIRDAVDEFARIPAWVWTGKLSAEPVARLPHVTMHGQEYSITTKGEVLTLNLGSNVVRFVPLNAPNECLRVCPPLLKAPAPDINAWAVKLNECFRVARPDRIFPHPFPGWTPFDNEPDWEPMPFGPEGGERMLARYSSETEGRRLYNLVTGEQLTDDQPFYLWREGCVLLRPAANNVTVIHDGATGEELFTMPGGISRLHYYSESHWLLQAGPNGVSCWGPEFRDRCFVMEFGDWRRACCTRNVWVFTRGSDCIVWHWPSCSGVQTEIAIDHAAHCETNVINGAAFILSTTVANARQFHIVPLLPVMQPAHQRSEWGKRRPPARLPEDLPRVQARLFMEAETLTAFPWPPQGSDTHPPIIATYEGHDVCLYRIV